MTEQLQFEFVDKPVELTSTAEFTLLHITHDNTESLGFKVAECREDFQTTIAELRNDGTFMAHLDLLTDEHTAPINKMIATYGWEIRRKA